MNYSNKYYGKQWKNHTRQAIQGRKKAEWDLKTMASIIILPFILPFIAIGALFGNKKSKMR